MCLQGTCRIKGRFSEGFVKIIRVPKSGRQAHTIGIANGNDATGQLIGDLATWHADEFSDGDLVLFVYGGCVDTYKWTEPSTGSFTRV